MKPRRPAIWSGWAGTASRPRRCGCSGATGRVRRHMHTRFPSIDIDRIVNGVAANLLNLFAEPAGFATESEEWVTLRLAASGALGANVSSTSGRRPRPRPRSPPIPVGGRGRDAAMDRNGHGGEPPRRRGAHGLRDRPDRRRRPRPSEARLLQAPRDCRPGGTRADHDVGRRGVGAGNGGGGTPDGDPMRGRALGAATATASSLPAITLAGGATAARRRGRPAHGASTRRRGARARRRQPAPSRRASPCGRRARHRDGPARSRPGFDDRRAPPRARRRPDRHCPRRSRLAGAADGAPSATGELGGNLGSLAGNAVGSSSVRVICATEIVLAGSATGAATATGT